MSGKYLKRFTVGFTGFVFIIMNNFSVMAEKADCLQGYATPAGGIEWLKARVSPVNLDDPAGDLKRNLEHGQTRFYYYLDAEPEMIGLSSTDVEIVCEAGFHFIPGVNLNSDDKELMELSQRVVSYIKRYNQLLLSKLK